MIKINNISKKFFIKNNEVQALNKINLIIEEKDCFAVVGESGSGKTTLANIILGVYQQDKGDLWFNEEQLHKTRNLQQRKLIQYVQQNPMSTLNPKKTIFSTISLPLRIHKIVKKNELEERVKQLLSYVGMEPEFMVRYPDTLSGGQKQRVAIARALAAEPKVLILDEPTSALDVIVQSKVLNLLLKIKMEFNLTYIFITHDLSVVRNIANKVVVMKKGIIEEFGETKKVFLNPQSIYTKELINAIPTVLDKEDMLKPK
ncbi:MAG: Glutathione import ATP-binding protein GsiA [Alphaproteobacteria bacterium MarineAlpha5_Bin9]|nr:MAG: Glutathione import ATP-binding protein GsiA [Alphaproteobacteria bacterium MarineAlpha5_Bin9]|tara:strand:- start:12592 stop:13368 length:777 start_codon:yes stop_codon:yes gene_type:complete